jgi:hypothetical protein
MASGVRGIDHPVSHAHTSGDPSFVVQAGDVRNLDVPSNYGPLWSNA